MSQKKAKQQRRHMRDWATEHKRRVDNGEPGLFIDEMMRYPPKKVRRIFKEVLK